MRHVGELIFHAVIVFSLESIIKPFLLKLPSFLTAWKSPQTISKSIFVWCCCSINLTVLYNISNSPWRHPSIAIRIPKTPLKKRNKLFFIFCIYFISKKRGLCLLRSEWTQGNLWGWPGVGQGWINQLKYLFFTTRLFKKNYWKTSEIYNYFINEKLSVN